MSKVTGAAHPATALAVITAFGGVMGYVRGKSIPSLVAGLTFGTLYGLSAKLINENKEWGVELATATSGLLGAASEQGISDRESLEDNGFP